MIRVLCRAEAPASSLRRVSGLAFPTGGALLDEVWGIDTKISTRTVDAHVKRLREKMGAARDYIETVRGVGYRFAEIPMLEALDVG